ncbi:MAG: nitroreductase family protein [Candidatus Thermoplasmatota archaeon]|nr:nitroreductase family protein [Candidatus Thermoplasmatota archaeon]
MDEELVERARQDTVLATLDARGSCRDYTGEPLPEPVVEQLVAGAQRAATDASGQMYSFIRIRDSDLRDRLATWCGEQAHVREASEFFVVCMDVHRLDRLLAHRDATYGMGPAVALLFGISDAALAAQSMALAAEHMGLGICYVGGLQRNVLEVAEVLDLPRGVLPLWGLCVGVRAKPPKRRPRIPTSLILHEDGYQEPDPSALDQAYEAMAPATRSGDWLNVISRYFAEEGTMADREPSFRALLERQGLSW